MRAVVQRVARASVRAGGETVAQIEAGLLALVGVGEGDGAADVAWLVDKLAHLRIFEDGAGKMNHSVLESGGAALVVSQFTLYGDARKGRRPSFSAAARPEVAEGLIAQVVAGLRSLRRANRDGALRGPHGGRPPERRPGDHHPRVAPAPGPRRKPSRRKPAPSGAGG